MKTLQETGMPIKWTALLVPQVLTQSHTPYTQTWACNLIRGLVFLTLKAPVIYIQKSFWGI